MEVTHEGKTDMNKARKHALIQEYEVFKMLKGETIVDLHKRFAHIVNHLGLAKYFNKEQLNIKILKCFDRLSQPKITASLLENS